VTSWSSMGPSSMGWRTAGSVGADCGVFALIVLFTVVAMWGISDWRGVGCFVLVCCCCHVGKNERKTRRQKTNEKKTNKKRKNAKKIGAPVGEADAD
jgi:hypothetical protein